MTLAELEMELRLIVSDASLAPFFKNWINQAIRELAGEFELPALKMIVPTSLEVDAEHWLYDLPANYHKKLWHCASPSNPHVRVLRGIDELDRIDPYHTETGNWVDKVAVSPDQLGIYPMAADTLSLWYYKLPEVLGDPQDPVRCIPPEFQPRVIIPKVVIKNFRILQDLIANPPHQSLAWWQAEYSNGLYGTRGGDIGMINYFAKVRGVRRHGGRDPLP